MAAKLLIEDRRNALPTPIHSPMGSGPVQTSMNRESQARFVAVLLFLLTVTAVVFAGFNFQAEQKVTSPDDGIQWTEKGGRLIADEVLPNSGGAKGGVKVGDELVAVNGQEVK